jgi:amino-acid N-acetyltransferase
MDILRATPADYPAISEALTQAALPLEGAEAAFGTGVVAREGDRVVGAAAVELYGDAALLRSVVVVPGRRGGGHGRALVAAAEGLAAEAGAREAYLLTETAAAWFGRLGYQAIERDDVPAGIATSVEFTTACAITAVAMRRQLSSS